MSLQVSETGSGLLIAEQSADREAVARLLRDHDSSLRLVPQLDEARSCTLWCVYRYLGPDRDAQFLCAWQTPSGEPLPLSSRLLDKVQQLDLRTVGNAPDMNALNDAHRAQVLRDRAATMAAIADDHKPYIDRGRVQISLGGRHRPKKGG